MGWTKRQFIAAAFEEIGLADYVFDLSPDQIQSALVRLDAMVGGLKGIFIHWPFSASPTDSNLDTDTRCPDYAIEAIFLNLAIAVAPSYGKVLSQDTKTNAANAYDTVVTWSTSLPPTRQTPAMLSGAGNKYWRGNKSIDIEGTLEPITSKGNDLIF
jgi:hypothetical protein